MRSMPMWASQMSAERRGDGRAERKAGERERQRQRVGVGEIVGERARSRPDEIGEHREIRREKQNGEERPGEAGVAVERNRRGKGGRALEAQNRPHASRTQAAGGGAARPGSIGAKFDKLAVICTSSNASAAAIEARVATPPALATRRYNPRYALLVSCGIAYLS